MKKPRRRLLSCECGDELGVQLPQTDPRGFVRGVHVTEDRTYGEVEKIHYTHIGGGIHLVAGVQIDGKNYCGDCHEELKAAKKEESK